MAVHPLEERKLPPSSGTRFGANRSATGRPPECGGGHCGVDLYYWKRDEGSPRGCANPARNIGIGRAVFAVAAGKVIAASASSSAGKFVWIDHGGWRSHYVHLDSYSVRVGEQVSEGQTIGTMGRTGIKCDPAHLHFALSRGGKYYNPEPSLSSWGLAAAGGIGTAGLVAAGLLALYWLRMRG